MENIRLYYAFIKFYQDQIRSEWVEVLRSFAMNPTDIEKVINLNVDISTYALEQALMDFP